MGSTDFPGMADEDEREQQNRDDDDRGRLRRSFAGLAVALLLVVAGIYLVARLHKQNEIEVCLEAGHHNCDALVGSP
jgi:flagellar biogenesis protein FliO